MVGEELDVVPAAGALVALGLVLLEGRETAVVSSASFIAAAAATVATAWWAVPAIVVAALWGVGGRIGGGLRWRVRWRIRGVGRRIRRGVRRGVSGCDEGRVGGVEEIREVEAWEPGVELGPEVRVV